MKVDRSLQNQFCDLLWAMGFHYDGSTGRPSLDDTWKETKLGGFTNGEFVVSPYWWGDCKCEGECSCRSSATNFEHIPSGFQLSWYKYPLRGSDSNIELTARMISVWRLKFN